MLDELAQAIATLINVGQRDEFVVRVSRTSYQNIHVLIQQKAHPLNMYIIDHASLWDAVWNSRSDELDVLQAAQWVLEQDPLSIHATLDFNEMLEADPLYARDFFANRVVREAARVWVGELRNRVRVRHQPQIQTQVVEKVVYKEPERQRWTDWLLGLIPQPVLVSTTLPVVILKGTEQPVWSPSGIAVLKPYLEVRTGDAALILGTESIEDAWATARNIKGLVYIYVFGSQQFWQAVRRQHPTYAEIDALAVAITATLTDQKNNEDEVKRLMEEKRRDEHNYS